MIFKFRWLIPLFFLASCSAAKPIKIGTLAINATSISFGSVNLNATVTQAITLTASGPAPVTINSWSNSGAGFSVSGLKAPLTLSRQSVTFYVQFNPTVSGNYTGALIINSNSTTAVRTVPLSGIGSNPHLVDLSWEAPLNSSIPVAGYNIYRTDSGIGNWSLINQGLIIGLSYEDSFVISGRAYDYHATSVGNDGSESIPSNTTTVIIP